MAKKKAEPKQEEVQPVFDPAKALKKAYNEQQPGSQFVFSLSLSPADADNFPYLSNWQIENMKFRVVGRLNQKGTKDILVQLKRVP